MTLWCLADEIIYENADRYVAYPAISPGQYYTDVDYFFRSPPWYFATNNNPYGDYLLFYKYQHISVGEPYLNDNEMNYYSSAAVDAVDIAIDDIPSNHTFKSWELDDRELSYYPYSHVHKYHRLKMYYGILHVGGSQTE